MQGFKVGHSHNSTIVLSNLVQNEEIQVFEVNTWALSHWSSCWASFVLTRSLLSRFAFLKDDITELASFSAIHALNIFTANDAAIPEKPMSNVQVVTQPNWNKVKEVWKPSEFTAIAKKTTWV